MTRLLVFLFLLLYISAAHGQEQKGLLNNNAPPSVSHEENNAQQGQPTWPVPFKPTQEIGADSQISFPTDI